MKLKIRMHFDAAHKLVGYDGDCANLHGHRWEVLFTVFTPVVKNDGIAVDFKRLKHVLGAVLPDHTYLNEWAPLEGGNPTAENLAVSIYVAASTCLDLAFLGVVNLEKLELWESPDCSVEVGK